MMKSLKNSKPVRSLCAVALLSALTLAACNERHDPAAPTSGTGKAVEAPEAMAFPDAPGGGETEAADSLVLRAQVALDRAGFSPGVIDGHENRLYALALGGFQEAHDLPATGKLDQATQTVLLVGPGTSATRRVVIPAAFARGPFARDLPHDEAGMAGHPKLSYRSMIEALAERFHTTPEMLATLNGPGTRLAAGATIRVPDIPDAALADLGEDPRGWADTLQRLAVAGDQPEADRVVVDKSQGTLRVYDAADKLVAQFPVTTGSSHDPLPIGTWKVRGESRNPDYRYNPDLFWDAKTSDKETLLPPGPNGPVGVVWIDLSKEHYGLHGTPEPQNIGKTESHGCVRLTNWDAARLAQMVKTGTTVVFEK